MVLKGHSTNLRPKSFSSGSSGEGKQSKSFLLPSSGPLVDRATQISFSFIEPFNTRANPQSSIRAASSWEELVMHRSASDRVENRSTLCFHPPQTPPSASQLCSLEFDVSFGDQSWTRPRIVLEFLGFLLCFLSRSGLVSQTSSATDQSSRRAVDVVFISLSCSFSHLALSPASS